MAYDFQVVIDAADPHALADWWADALGWETEPTDEDFIRRMVAEGQAPEEATITHNGHLKWREGSAIRHPDKPEGGLRGRILFQLVPETKTVKNRVHLDLRVGADNVERELTRLAGRGATFSHRGQQGPHAWITILDPEGNELCLS